MTTKGASPVLADTIYTYEEFDYALKLLGAGHHALVSAPMAEWRQASVTLDGVHLEVLQEGGANFFEGEASDRYVTLVLGLPGPTLLTAQGKTFREGTLGRALPGETITSSSRGICRYVNLVVPTERFVESCQSLDPALLERMMSDAVHFDIPAAKHRMALSLVEQALDTAAAGLFASPVAQQVAVADLIRAFVEPAQTLAVPPRTPGRSRLPRPHIIHRLREYLESLGKAPGSVVEMARYCEVSERSLRDVVREQWGVAPSQLMSVRRLRAVRADLRCASADQTVTEIASGYGIWELGRFASNYRAIFGELPSETLAGSQTRSKEPIVAAESNYRPSPWWRGGRT